ncbi:FAD-binding domain-containing protein [Rickenella mellea]|uniref:FAD-binding domain-containing protein n=1 Tax=Rickenella mellea TaxID=50990 RepID=A0A4Y7PRA8_9AGAM|nr:FAD-binding domain-containing protein [Rickenella mellea]
MSNTGVIVFLVAFLITTIVRVSGSPSPLTAAQTACQLLNTTLPNLVSFPGSQQFSADISHWRIESTQNATCSIEPATPEDVSNILKIVGWSDIRAPFAVKGGGHAFNEGFSSTLGVQISMAKFNSIHFDESSNTVTLGTGLTWDVVYAKLNPLGVTVAGGRVSGVGNAGLSLGGGYSRKTDQVGLTVDTIVSHDIVLPSGEITHVTNQSNPDLFFALRGGLNNFGIVTAITYIAQPQTQIFGGSITYTQNISDINKAVEAFDLTNTDPKAQLVALYGSFATQFTVEVILFYDAPTPPPGTFDEFLKIPSVSNDAKTSTFPDFISRTAGIDTGLGPIRQVLHVVPIVKYTVPILEEIVAQVTSIGKALSARFNGSTVAVAFTAEPFTNPFAHSLGGAYPHPPSRQVTPANPGVAVQASAGAAAEPVILQAVKDLSRNVQARAIKEGQSKSDDLLYPNYALSDTPLELMYGSNVARLRSIAEKVDPQNVMGLTGGFKFQ